MMTSKRSYYDILQVSMFAEQEVIDAAYKRLALKYHPDANSSANATQKMQEINEAYSVLHDPIRRTEYDKITNFKRTSTLSGDDVEEIKHRADEEKQKRNEAESVRQRVDQEKESFKKYAEEEHLRREKAEQALRRANSRRNTNLVKLLSIFGILILGGITITLLTIITLGFSKGYTHTAASIPTPTLAPIPNSTGTKFIQGDVINFIPSISEMPIGFSEDPASGPLPYGNADGYSQIYKNPNFILLDREVFVGYFTFIFEGSDSASKILTEFVDEMTKGSDIQYHEVEKADDEKLAKIDQSYLYYFETKTPSGNYNIAYITGIQFSNFINLILISAPTDDPSSERAKVIRERLRELSYYYTSLVTNKLPLPIEKQILLPEPEYQRVSPTAPP